MLEALSLLLLLHEILPLTAATPEEGLARVARGNVDVVIADMNFSADTTSGDEGVALFDAIRERHPDLPVILLTGWSRLETAVELVKAGAADYLSKPWDDAKLLATVENLLELSEHARAAESTRVTRRQRRQALERNYDLCGIVFASDEMLRVLESGEFERLGSTRTRRVKVRVVSATNADIPAMIRDGKFREDLFYRMNTIEIAVPPLADRSEDILPLAEHWLGDAAALSDEARDALMAWPWPGSVRELKNVIERAKLLCGDGAILETHLGLSPTPMPPGRRDDPSRETIEKALRRANGVVSTAARSLGLSRQALYRRMQRYGIPGGA